MLSLWFIIAHEIIRLASVSQRASKEDPNHLFFTEVIQSETIKQDEKVN